MSRILACTAFVLTLGLFSAAAAVAQTPFTNEAVSRGIAYIPTQNNTLGSGMAFADLDNDGDDDVILIGRATNALGLYENNGSGQFTARITGSGMPVMSNASGIVAADYDGDGLVDIYVTRRAMANKLMRNLGNFTFADVSVAAGVADTGAGQGCAWADYDGDGWIDLYLSNRTTLSPAESANNRLFRNQRDGTFVDVAEQLGVHAPGDPTLMTVFFDYNRDMRPDIYLCTDKGNGCVNFTNHLYENNGDGTFTDVTIATGTQACVDCMGTAIGDFDGDNLDDIYVTNTPVGNSLLLNQGDGTYVNGAPTAGVVSNSFGWGAVFFDMDNDGWLDIYICNNDSPNKLFRNEGPGQVCPDMAPTLGVAFPNYSYCVATSDIDLDGDLDMLVQEWNQQMRLFMNNQGNARNWLEVKLVGQWPNTQAVGARVELFTGPTQQSREIYAGIGYKSSSSQTAHFGLDMISTIDLVRVTWPNGEETYQFDVAANQRLTITQEPRFGDINGDSSIDGNDIAGFLRCLKGTGQMHDNCNWADIDGENGVTSDDVALFVSLLLGS